MSAQPGAPAGDAPAAPAAPQSPADTLAAARASLRDAVMAGKHLESATTPPAPSSAPAATPSPAASAAPAPAAAPAQPTDEPEAAGDQPPSAASGESPAQAAARKAEQHWRRQIAQERAAMREEFERDRAGWQARVARAAELETKMAGARDDFLGHLEALGFTSDDYEPLVRLLYSQTAEGQKDPRHRAAAQEALARRKRDLGVSELQKQVAELQKQIAQRDQEATARQHLDAYATKVAQAASEATPLARAALAKAPEKARAALLAVADRLYIESGPSDDLREVPTPQDVLEAYEEQRRAELEELGIDVTPWLPRPAAAPAASASSAPAASASSAPAASASSAAPRTKGALLAEIKARNAARTPQ